MANRNTFECKIIEHICTLGVNGTTTKELNIVQFGRAQPKLDVRAWHTVDGEKLPLKGITLTPEEAAALWAAIGSREDIPKPTEQKGLLDAVKGFISKGK